MCLVDWASWKKSLSELMITIYDTHTIRMKLISQRVLGDAIDTAEDTPWRTVVIMSSFYIALYTCDTRLKALLNNYYRCHDMPKLGGANRQCAR